jgi:hypothetical protein
VEAACATTAAPLYFKPFELKDYNIRFVDGGIRANNPIYHIMEEKNNIWGEERPIGCIVSLGTGLKQLRPIPSNVNLVKILKALMDITTDGTITEKHFASWHPGKELKEAGKYYRFQVTQGMQFVDLSDWKSIFKMFPMTLRQADQD